MTATSAASPRAASPLDARGAAATGPALPRWSYLPVALAVCLLVLPLAALLVRADWPKVPAALTSPVALDALWLSLRCGLIATVLCLLLGVPLALVLARSDGAGARVLRALVTVPLVLPPMVGGIALLYLLGVRGLIGESLGTWFGWRIPYTTLAVVIAETFVALPFLVLTVEGAVRALGQRYQAMAATLGASPGTVLWRVTLPLLGPGILAGLVLCFAKAMGEFGATITFVSNIPGETQTLPSAIYTLTQVPGGEAGAMRLTLISIAVSMAALVLSELLARGVARRLAA